MAAKVSIRAVEKRYPSNQDGGSVLALESVSLDIADGQFVSLVGPSGCGKTTLLYMIAGFESITSGDIRVDERVVTGPGPDRGVVFQDYALFPWKTALENVMFGMERKGIPKEECVARAREYLELVNLTDFADRYPHQLSGGMRQRCALVRSMATVPKVLLMDEPLAAIDALTRNTLQEKILTVCGARNDEPRKTVIYVTHSIEEAIFMSDRVVIMTPRPGKVLKVLDIPFGSDRNDATRLKPEFRELSGEIWQLLKLHLKDEQ